MKDPAPLRWRKSTRSGSESNCVEVPQSCDRIRDSKNKSIELMVGQAGWASFLTAAKSGTFDEN
jgi:hypothetical protein